MTYTRGANDMQNLQRTAMTCALVIRFESAAERCQFIRGRFFKRVRNKAFLVELSACCVLNVSSLPPSRAHNVSTANRAWGTNHLCIRAHLGTAANQLPLGFQSFQQADHH